MMKHLHLQYSGPPFMFCWLYKHKMDRKSSNGRKNCILEWWSQINNLSQPNRYGVSNQEYQACIIIKSLYCLMQAPQA